MVARAWEIESCWNPSDIPMASSFLRLACCACGEAVTEKISASEAIRANFFIEEPRRNHLTRNVRAQVTRFSAHECDMMSGVGCREHIYQPRDLGCVATVRRTHFCLAGQRAGFPGCPQAGQGKSVTSVQQPL